jgi:N-acetylmuramoyl-L-alanine amidase
MQDVARRNGLRPLVIAIDAGHGGQDPGAKGPGGTREKMVTLAIARELARQVNATPGLKAYLTRDTDVFIPLVQRYQKARAAKADLFVSIHADSFTSPDASGSSVFVLSQRGASSQAARWLANQENAADLVGGVKLQDKDDTLASVLLDLSQSATLKASEDMASQVLGGLKRLGPTHKGEVERANFVVLRSPDVPSMLVETAFISNPDEERRLNDPAHQAQLARAILDGVTSYFTRQPPPGTLYAARADAGGNAGMPGGGSR